MPKHVVDFYVIKYNKYLFHQIVVLDIRHIPIWSILNLLHVYVSAALMPILTEVSYKGYITKTKDQRKFKKVSSKMYGLFYILIHAHAGGGL